MVEYAGGATLGSATDSYGQQASLADIYRTVNLDVAVLRAAPVPFPLRGPDEIVAFCRTGLTEYKVPRAVEIRETLPMSPLQESPRERWTWGRTPNWRALAHRFRAR